jgi:hypothetical protein
MRVPNGGVSKGTCARWVMAWLRPPRCARSRGPARSADAILPTPTREVQFAGAQVSSPSQPPLMRWAHEKTAKTSHLPLRDRATCADGKACTLASRAAAHRRLQQLAADGDATGFEGLLKSAVIGDCRECGKHRKWHTKHTHCTMDCGGNNGLVEGPCFEGCKAGVDINAFLADVSKEVAKHAADRAGTSS